MNAPSSNQVSLVSRLRRDDPADYAKKQKELLEWTGSAFLAGEKLPPDGMDDLEHKGQLYSFLCGMIGYLCAAEETATNAREAAARIERLEGALEGIANAFRLGSETDVAAWKSLANACQQTALSALRPDDQP